MGTNPPDMGTGLFGYRKAAVHQMIGDRDAMLRRANERLRQAEVKCVDFEATIAGLTEQQTKKDEQIKRLRAQLDELSSRTAETEDRWKDFQTESDGRRRQLESELEDRRQQLDAETERRRREI